MTADRTLDGSKQGVLASLNVSEVLVVEHHGRDVTTGIFKRPVKGRRHVHGVNVSGDDQADRRVHGGVYKAIYAYAAEDYGWWSEQLGREISAGSFGENLTTQNIDINNAHVGDQWTIGSVLLEVGEPRVPCFKLGIAMDDPDFPDRFAAAGRPGAYLRILEEGELGAGDHIEITDVHAPTVTIGDFARAFHEHVGVDRIASTRLISPSWREWADRQLSRGR